LTIVVCPLRAVSDTTGRKLFERNYVYELILLLLIIVRFVYIHSTVLRGMPTIQYSAGSGPLSVHKLFTSCIRR